MLREKETSKKETSKKTDPRAVVLDHAYLSAGDTPYASGDRAYTGCFLCGRSRKEHAA